MCFLPAQPAQPALQVAFRRRRWPVACGLWPCTVGQSATQGPPGAMRRSGRRRTHTRPRPRPRPRRPERAPHACAGCASYNTARASPSEALLLPDPEQISTLPASVVDPGTRPRKASSTSTRAVTRLARSSPRFPTLRNCITATIVDVSPLVLPTPPRSSLTRARLVPNKFHTPPPSRHSVAVHAHTPNLFAPATFSPAASSEPRCCLQGVPCCLSGRVPEVSLLLPPIGPPPRSPRRSRSGRRKARKSTLLTQARIHRKPASSPIPVRDSG